MYCWCVSCVFLSSQELESEAQYRQAEQHFVDGGDWKAAVNMHRAKNMWDDAYRVGLCVPNSGVIQLISTGFRLLSHTVDPMLLTRWPTSGPRPSEERVQSNSSLSLVCLKLQWTMLLTTSETQQIMFTYHALTTYHPLPPPSSFEFAFSIARLALRSKLTDIHLKHALFLEDEGKFDEAEEEFVAAGKPKEAVLMHVHQQKWDSAQRVAEMHCPESVADVLVGQVSS